MGTRAHPGTKLSDAPLDPPSPPWTLTPVRPEGAPGTLVPEVLGARMFLSDAPVWPTTAGCSSWLAPAIGVVDARDLGCPGGHDMTDDGSRGTPYGRTWLPASFTEPASIGRSPCLGSRLCTVVYICVLWSGQSPLNFRTWPFWHTSPQQQPQHVTIIALDTRA